MYLACINASELIRGHVESGLYPEDVNELDEKGLEEYSIACARIAKKLDKISLKYKIK